MSITTFEKKITPELKWKNIENIPDFPLSSFDEVKQKLKTNEFSVGIDFITSNELAQWLYGSAHKKIFLLLASTPIIVAIISLVLTFVLGNYWLLFGIILGFAGQFLSNPYNSSKIFGRIVVGILFLVFLYGP